MKKTSRTFKRFAALTSASLLAACMVAPMAMTSNAAVTKETISFSYSNEDTTDHTYIAYKIFNGTVESGELKNITWANEEGSSSFLTALKNDPTIGTAFKDCTTAASVAEILGEYQNKSPEAIAFAKLAAAQKDNLVTVNAEASSTISATSDGYYVIVEQAESGNEDWSMSSYLLSTYDASEGAEIAVKKALPEFDKQIYDVNDSDAESGEWGEDADHDIGDDVSFKLIATLPDDYASYSSYTLTFHDALEATVWDWDGSAKIYYGADDTTGADINFTASSSCTDVEKCNWEYTIADLKTTASTLEAGDKVTIIYDAELTESANIGEKGNWNTGRLEYSNNPEYNGSGDLTTSFTPEDKVVAFTYKLSIDKKDGANDKDLTGAGFTLYKMNAESGEYEIVGEEITGVTTFEWIGLDDGNYKIEESTVPKGYNEIDDIEFTVSATHEDEALKELDDGALNGTVTLANGLIKQTIENYSGSTLPSTGGIGTTVFYLGGGAMVAVAGVYLISKKRMKNTQE